MKTNPNHPNHPAADDPMATDEELRGFAKRTLYLAMLGVGAEPHTALSVTDDEMRRLARVTLGAALNGTDDERAMHAAGIVLYSKLPATFRSEDVDDDLVAAASAIEALDWGDTNG